MLQEVNLNTMTMVPREDVLGQERYEISKSRLDKVESLVKTLPVKSFSAEIISKAGEIDPNNIEGDIKLFDFDRKVKNTMISMAKRMKSKSLKDTLQFVCGSNKNVNMVYAVVVCHKDPDSPYYDMAVAKYDFMAALGTENKRKIVARSGLWKFLFGETREVNEKRQVKLTAEEGEMLMDTYVPHRLLLHLKNQGMISAITYCE